MRKCYDLIGDNMEEKKLNIEEMEELGIADYYLDLTRSYRKKRSYGCYEERFK